MDPPVDLNLVYCFYQQFLFFADSAILVGFKIGRQVLDDPVVDPVDGGGSPYGGSIKDDSQESRIEKRRRHDDKFGG